MLLLCSLLGLTLFTGFEAKSSLVIYKNYANSVENSTFSIRTEEDQPELVATWKYLSNAALADFICAYDGIWFYYYSIENYGRGEYSTRHALHGSCSRASSGIHAGSARYVGEREVQRLNLYNGVDFTSNATTFLTSQASISTRFRSLALVGNVPVQLYLQPNYGGFSYCVQALSLYFTRIEDTAQIGLQPGDVKSIRFGCTADAMVIQLQESNADDPAIDVKME